MGALGLSQFIGPVIGDLTPAPGEGPGEACGLKASPSGCLPEHILCKKEDLGVSERLVGRKEAQLKVKRALGECVPLGRARAMASFSQVTVLSVAFEIPFNHVHRVHLMPHRWWVHLVCLDKPHQGDGKAGSGDTGSPSPGSGKIWRKEAG